MNFSYSQASGWKRGDIRIWTRPLSEIPHGWQLCDGTNGTPNLLDRALVGAGRMYQQHEMFGDTFRYPLVNVQPRTLTHQNLPAHNHTFARVWFHENSGGSNVWGISGSSSAPTATSYTGGNVAHNHDATVTPIDTRQPSIGIIFIMKMR